ncbi:hypothetical protein PR202_gb08599 [Eleusine coracana subsp. coracana]|uniref:Uncharacterized protein n=1 Tax=Eleusine coracana subsp. coracana TaxID=191504 RepID=A0AAV5ECK6_ELECO|nr:hypothetical protein PR202_gb08599 [Eleusine coracana subsp. coracana]
MWTRGEDKLLELLFIRRFPQWDVIAAHILDKTPEQVSQRCESVVDEVTRLLHGLQVDTPREWDTQTVVAAAPPEAETEAAAAVVPTAADVIAEKALVPVPSSAAEGEASERVGKKRKKSGGDRKKPEKWTEEEHNLFLEGLEKYGKGKWKAMSTEYLTTKTASQIASHHQKHRIRQELRERNACKRASIHDITTPTSAASAGRAGEPPAAAQKDEHGTDEGGDDELILVGAVEEFPGEDDPGTLFT